MIRKRGTASFTGPKDAASKDNGPKVSSTGREFTHRRVELSRKGIGAVEKGSSPTKRSQTKIIDSTIFSDLIIYLLISFKIMLFTDFAETL